MPEGSFPAPPDGHTIILGHVGTLAVNPYAMKKHPYDVNKSFVPVALLARVPNVFVVNSDVPAKSFKEFVDYAKKNPGKLNYGSAGNGSAGHLAFEYLKSVTGMFVVHVPYRGTGPQLQDLLAGRTEASSAGSPALLGHIKSGKLRAIAVGTPERIRRCQMSDVAEMGYPGFETSQCTASWRLPEIRSGCRQDGQRNRQGAEVARYAALRAGRCGRRAGRARHLCGIHKEGTTRWQEVVKRAGIIIE